ncbi:hypothetical protein MRX96_013914 [Rhipicephalus microplus]
MSSSSAAKMSVLRILLSLQQLQLTDKTINVQAQLKATDDMGSAKPLVQQAGQARDRIRTPSGDHEEQQKSSNVVGNDTSNRSSRSRSKKRAAFCSKSLSRSRGPQSAQKHTEHEKTSTAPSPALKSTSPQPDMHPCLSTAFDIITLDHTTRMQSCQSWAFSRGCHLFDGANIEDLGHESPLVKPMPPADDIGFLAQAGRGPSASCFESLATMALVDAIVFVGPVVSS